MSGVSGDKKGVGFFVVDPASLFLYVFFLMCSAYFACSETAYTAVSKVRLRTLADKGNKRAQKALWICDRFDKTLTTILVGNNVFHAACASLSALLVLRQLGEQYVAAGTVVTTVIVYLFAEMLPKSLARARSEEIALLLAGSMRALVRLLTPISAIFSGISNVLSKFFAESDSGTVTEEDLISIIETIEDEGILEPEQMELVNSAMEFRDKRAKDIMIPIEFVEAVSSATPTEELVKLATTLPYSRLPVYEGNRDNIVGILPVNLFLSFHVSGKPVPLRKLLMKPYPLECQCAQLILRSRGNQILGSNVGSNAASSTDCKIF